MKVLWLCNIALPVVARHMGMESSNKEGWISGMAGTVLAGQQENGIRLSVAFPVSSDMLPPGEEIRRGTVTVVTASLSYYGFREDVSHPEKYDGNLEPALKKIVSIVEPDIVHCFGTEYPHTLAMCRVFPRKDRLLLGLQGLCTLYAEAYFADLPRRVIRSVTLRDFLKKDSLRQQQEKFVLRGETEREAVRIAGNVTGRTRWDRVGTAQWNPDVHYHEMNETLRPEFYGPVWTQEGCEPHSIFVSQGDYPIKGLHYMLSALPAILRAYPDTKLYVAGNSLVEYRTLKQKLKISAYGKYLRSLLKQGGIEERVTFLGKLDAERMRDRYLASDAFVCCSSIENSPNSLGEAMLLGVPCISADVGGISSLFRDGVDGILYRGFSGDGTSGPEDGDNGGELEAVAGRLAEAVIRMWSDQAKKEEYGRNARRHALNTHDGDRNYRRLLEIYEEIL